MFDIDHLPCGCLITSPDKKILSTNQYLCEALGWQPETLTGRNVKTLLDKATQLFCESYVFPIVLREGQCCEVLLALTSPDGATYPNVANVRKMPDGNLAWVFLEAENRGKLFKELEPARYAIQQQSEQLEMMARTDELTGLSNRRDLEISARRVFLEADRAEAVVSVAILDIDRFKSINDTHGHDVGDQVIRALADVLTSICRKSDIVARLGGDEFVFVLNNTDASQARLLCDRIHEMVGRILVNACRITVSIGLAVRPLDTQIPLANMLKLADECLYMVKENGRNASKMMTASAA